VRRRVEAGEPVLVQITPSGDTFTVDPSLTPRERKIILAGGLLNYVRTL